MFYSDDQWLSWMDELAENDYVIADNFISEDLYQSIMQYFAELEQADKLNKAGIGAQQDFTVKAEIRGDFIYWLDESRDQPMAPFFGLMEELNQSLRRFCYLSLPGSEFHLAKYPAGSHYHRHLDQFQERSNRQITVLIYLNKNWKPGNGGELVIYKDDQEIKVEPIAKRLLLFKSDVIEHEVLTTNVPRYSLTGWLLKQPAEVGFLLG
ncbi:2OG-Fe(II) oxygenase [Gracilimonas mengyeensis]|uniref:SM-20-related protein n=1 Tax=Gracilimonas mengyeensis TaxID=1302730 RepID=A0A521CNU6_9BACT|nr:2OG-Fe(II) oxygenase [Gracilimonas mengyeensis]SMO61116.1 SM-20-related protein [Gracilimonas mengyeensis]